MTNRLTASEAHEIATNWQSNECAKYVDHALEAIKERAEKGFFTADVRDPYPDNVNRDECVRAMKELGYEIDVVYSHYTRWRW